MQSAVGNQDHVAFMHLELHADVAPEQHVAFLNGDQPMVVMHMRRRTHFMRLYERLAVKVRALGINPLADAARELAVLRDRTEPLQLLAEIPTAALSQPFARCRARHALLERGTPKAVCRGLQRGRKTPDQCDLARFSVAGSPA